MESERVGGELVDVLSNIWVVKAFSARTRERGRFERLLADGVEARACREVLADHASMSGLAPWQLDGVLVLLPNFGNETGVANVFKLGQLRVPILIQAYPDDLNLLGVERRRLDFLLCARTVDGPVNGHCTENRDIAAGVHLFQPLPCAGRRGERRSGVARALVGDEEAHEGQPEAQECTENITFDGVDALALGLFDEGEQGVELLVGL